MTTDTATASTPSELDLAFVIDATSSMSPYIESAQEVRARVNKRCQLWFKTHFVCVFIRTCAKLLKISF